MTQFGIDKLMSDLNALGYLDVEHIQDPQGNSFALLAKFHVNVGRFAGRIVELAIPAPNDYGRLVGSAIHLRSKPHLLDKRDSVPNVKNITDSALGPEWRYWSHRFEFFSEDPTKHLMLQINGVLRHA
jgi:hypothetical protein